MDADAKKTALRMIPYGLYVLTAEKDGNKINGEAYSAGTTGAPVLASVPAYVECSLEQTVENGDHSIFIGKVVNAAVRKQPEGRADLATLHMADLGDKVFYGG